MNKKSLVLFVLVFILLVSSASVLSMPMIFGWLQNKEVSPTGSAPHRG